MYQPKPVNEHNLSIEDGHKVYFAEYGNLEGPAIISVHGGPGSASKPKHAARFDLSKYRVVVFDQRGCGKSEYEDMLRENTTAKLASDMERIREELEIESWIVTGSSWGSSLSLFYAQSYPEKVDALLLSAIFLGDSLTMEWFAGSVGVSSLYTDVWDHRNTQLQKLDITASSAKEINQKLHTLEGAQLHSLVADILNWEGNLMSANGDVNYMRPEDVSEDNITYAKLFMHYESNSFFMDDELLLNQIPLISHIPTAIIHGRHDVLCPFKRAWDVYQAHELSEIVALPQSNHMFSADGEIAKKYFFQAFLAKHGLS